MIRVNYKPVHKETGKIYTHEQKEFESIKAFNQFLVSQEFHDIIVTSVWHISKESE